MKTFTEVKTEFINQLPLWYDETMHTKLIEVLSTENKGKLHGCKLLRDTSNTLKDQWYGKVDVPKTEEMFLKEAKELCDFVVDGIGKKKKLYNREDIKGLMLLAYNKGAEYVREHYISKITGHSNPYEGKDGDDVFAELFEEYVPRT